MQAVENRGWNGSMKMQKPLFGHGPPTNKFSAAMRLRQLGTTQSVTFLAPPEVYCGIVDLRLAHTREGNVPALNVLLISKCYGSGWLRLSSKRLPPLVLLFGPQNSRQHFLISG